MIEDFAQAHDLLPCPFCASSDVTFCSGPTPFIFCRTCESNGPTAKPPRTAPDVHAALDEAAVEAARLWNSRAPVSARRPRRVRVSEAVAVELHGMVVRGCVGVEVGRSDGMVEVLIDGDTRVRKFEERYVKPITLDYHAKRQHN